MELEYEVEEETEGRRTLKLTLNSGDAFVANSKVKSLSYAVLKTTENYKQQLVMRDGCLLIQAERD